MPIKHIRKSSTTVLLLYAVFSLSTSANETNLRNDAMLIAQQRGIEIVRLLRAGETIGEGGYRFAGLADGIGILNNGNSPSSLFITHEINPTKGIKRAHGANGAFISRLTVDKKDKKIIGGNDHIQHVWLFDSERNEYQINTTEFGHFCSADLPPSSALYFSEKQSNYGTTERIFFGGEEMQPRYYDRYGRAFAHIISGNEIGNSYELPHFGKMAFENILLNPLAQRKTIAMLTDDAGAEPYSQMDENLHRNAPSELYIYIGEKRTSGNIVERAGLIGGTLNGIRVLDLQAEHPLFGLSALRKKVKARFDLVILGDVARDNTGKKLQEESVRRKITQFRRIEDGAWNVQPNQANEFYFTTTDSFGGHSRLYKLTFDDIHNPQKGGEIELVINGRDYGMEMLDNITMDETGRIILLEDPGKNEHLATVWLFDPAIASVFRIAQAKPDYFDATGRTFLTIDEEVTGVVPATELFGPGWFVLNVQAHKKLLDQPDVVEAGELLALYIPRTDQLVPAQKLFK